MTKTQMPEPVGYQWLDTGHFRKKVPADADASAFRSLITTTQAEAYADARVREALEHLDEALDAAFSKLQTDDKSHDFWMGVGSALEAAERAIRALILATK